MKQAYIRFLKKMSVCSSDNYNSNLEAAKKNAVGKEDLSDDFDFLIYAVHMAYSLFELTGDVEARNEALRMLTDYGRYAKAHGKSIQSNDVILLSWMFGTASFIYAYSKLRKDLSEDVDQIIYKGIEGSINRIFTFPEHGSHNRVMLRCVNLLAAAKYLQDSSYTDDWKRLGHRLLMDNLRTWSIEDASTYLPIWLSLLIKATELTDQEKVLYRSPLFKYYGDYLLELMAPNGMIPGFGDGRMGSSWHVTLSLFEKYADVYGDGRFKWAATRMMDVMDQLDDGSHILTLKHVDSLVDAFRWTNEAILPEQPEGGSVECMDNQIGKKIVFRSGYDIKSTYLLMNYKDEAGVSPVTRLNIMGSIPVPAEKTHHGHEDENAIVCMMAGGSVLLRDGGYRNNDGSLEQWRKEWRSDLYHNTVLLRKGKQDTDNFWDYCDGDGAYVPVSTQKLYFHSFDEIDVSRIVKTNAQVGLEHHRCMHYLKQLNCFILVDFIRATTEGHKTFGVQYFSRQVDQVSDHSFVTGYDYIASDEFMSKIPNDVNQKLLITYPKVYQCQTKTVSRGYTMETSVSNSMSTYMKVNEWIPMVTILMPCNDKVNVDALEASISFECHEDKTSVVITKGEKTHTLGLRADFMEKFDAPDRRPSYSFEAGKKTYGDFTTDAYALYVTESPEDLYFAFVDSTAIHQGNEAIFEVKPVEHLQLDKSECMGVSSWSAYDQRIKKAACDG